MRTVSRAAVPAILVLGLIFSTSIADAQARSSKSTPRTVAVGVSMDPSGKDTSWASVQQVKTKTGRYPALWSIWSTWGTLDAAARFPTKTDPTFMADLKTNHIVPMVVWQPSNPKSPVECGPHDPAHNVYVTQGKFDAYIKQWAKDAKAYGSRVILRLAQEMNGSWNPWGDGACGNTGTSFINMWHHVYNIFKSVGATNVKFLWSPFQPCGHTIGCVPYSDVFPGNSYVDYIGYSTFNWYTPPAKGAPRRPWTDMATVMQVGYKKLVQLSSKPIIVAELASNRQGGDQAKWISQGYPAAYSAYPHIVAIVYFDINMTDSTDPSQPNWTFTADAWNAYRTVVNLKHFKGTIN
jgi:Glycosyl hydrolase family 26